MDTEKTLSQQESFEIIQRMISTAKNEMDNNSFYNLLWGWLVLAASVGHYVLMKAGFEHPYIMWVLMPIGGVVTMIYAYRHERHKKVRSYVEDLLNYVLIAFLVSLVMVLSFMSILQLNTYPMVLIIYGIWLFVQGGALRFKPLIIGGIINWLCAIASFFVLYDVQLLILAFAVLAGYIIPGYMISNRARKSQNAMV